MKSRQGCRFFASFIMTALFLSGCASGRKQKLEQREKLAASSGLYCDFVNGDKNQEVEIELNLVMAKKCDSDKPFTISDYKTPAEVTGVLYCCAIRKTTDARTAELKIDKVAPPTTVPAPTPQKEKTPPKPDNSSEMKFGPTTVPAPAAASPKGRAPVDKKTKQPQDDKSNSTKELEDEVVPL